jgi:hypothetical protein
MWIPRETAMQLSVSSSQQIPSLVGEPTTAATKKGPTMIIESLNCNKTSKNKFKTPAFTAKNA